MQTFEVGDKVAGINGNFKPFTGTVSHVYVGFVQVTYDIPQGTSTYTLTSPANLKLVSRGGVAHVPGRPPVVTASVVPIKSLKAPTNLPPPSIKPTTQVPPPYIEPPTGPLPTLIHPGEPNEEPAT
jgi:hypothetical protein